MKYGIIADNYKVEKFKAELKKIGIETVETHPFSADTTSIIIKTTAIHAKEIGDLCKRVEFHFKHAN